MAANPYELTTREVLSILFKERLKLIGVFVGSGAFGHRLFLYC